MKYLSIVSFMYIDGGRPATSLETQEVLLAQRLCPALDTGRNEIHFSHLNKDPALKHLIPVQVFAIFRKCSLLYLAIGLLSRRELHLFPKLF